MDVVGLVYDVERLMRACFCVWCVKCAKYLAFGTFSTPDGSALNPVLRAVMTLRHHSMTVSSQLFQEVIKNWTWKLLHYNIW